MKNSYISTHGMKETVKLSKIFIKDIFHFLTNSDHK